MLMMQTRVRITWRVELSTVLVSNLILRTSSKHLLQMLMMLIRVKTT